MPFWDNWNVHWAADFSESEESWNDYLEAVEFGFVPEKIRDRIEVCLSRSRDHSQRESFRGLALGDAWVNINQWSSKWRRELEREKQSA